MGVEGNEGVDILAKQALKLNNVDIEIPLSRTEGKAIIKKYVGKVWQEYWDLQDTGRHLYKIQRQVGVMRRKGRNRREEAIITRLKIGHTGLNNTLHKIGKHPDGSCDHCGQPESVKHVLLECRAYEEERRALITTANNAKIGLNIESLLKMETNSVNAQIISFLKETGLMERI